MGKFVSNRPIEKKRLFKSISVENEILKIKKDINDEKFKWMFENCFSNTIDTTVQYEEINGKPDSFIITGDIPAMWLRDSVAQIWPYLKYVNCDNNIDKLFHGLINRQVKCILLDPYANAFYKDPETVGPHINDKTEMKPSVHERKWEIDSLCYFIRLSYFYWKVSENTTCFDNQWLKAVKLIIDTFRKQQSYGKENQYIFQRHENLSIFGKGNPTKQCGLIRSGFRPSDDPCIFHFHIPDNCFAVVSLRQLSVIFEIVFNDSEFSGYCKKFSDEIDCAIKEYGIHANHRGEKIFAYEIDGFGGRIFMDDANIPSLLSLPYLGYCANNDEVYKNTRSAILSTDNPFFVKGKYGAGIGSPHVDLDYLWPMSIIMRALTSTDDKEIAACLKMLLKTDANTGFMHESFYVNDSEKYTRPWFGWANSLFGELIVNICENSNYTQLLNTSTDNENF